MQNQVKCSTSCPPKSKEQVEASTKNKVVLPSLNIVNKDQELELCGLDLNSKDLIIGNMIHSCEEGEVRPWIRTKELGKNDDMSSYIDLEIHSNEMPKEGPILNDYNAFEVLSYLDKGSEDGIESRNDKSISPTGSCIENFNIEDDSPPISSYAKKYHSSR